MTGKEAKIIFELNAANITGSGGVRPTEPVVVTPSAEDGTFSVNLTQTTNMMLDAWYRMKIRWLGADAGAALIDFPELKIIVPSGGGDLSQLLPDGAPGFNRAMVWVSLTEPPKSLPMFTLWLHSDPDDPDNSNRQSTGKLYELREV